MHVVKLKGLVDFTVIDRTEFGTSYVRRSNYKMLSGDFYNDNIILIHAFTYR